MNAPAENTPAEKDVPQELKDNKAMKESAEQMAEEQLKNQIPKGDMILSALGYVGFLCILPLVIRRESVFCQHHANQALVLAVTFYFLDTLNILPTTLVTIYMVFKYAVIAYSAYNALKGKKHKLPFIYGLSQKFQVIIK